MSRRATDWKATRFSCDLLWSQVSDRPMYSACLSALRRKLQEEQNNIRSTQFFVFQTSFCLWSHKPMILCSHVSLLGGSDQAICKTQYFLGGISHVCWYHLIVKTSRNISWQRLLKNTFYLLTLLNVRKSLEGASCFHWLGGEGQGWGASIEMGGARARITFQPLSPALDIMKSKMWHMQWLPFALHTHTVNNYTHIILHYRLCNII